MVLFVMFCNEPIIMIYCFNYRCGCKLNGGELCWFLFSPEEVDQFHQSVLARHESKFTYTIFIGCYMVSLLICYGIIHVVAKL